MGQRTGGNVTQFLYDANGLFGMVYLGGTYYYQYNGQGDVIGLVDYQGNQVVTYTYDAWGNPVSIGGTQASSAGAANPFRYRGYYYDAESGLYYLQSRYYDPVVGRFINLDDGLTLDLESHGLNLFTYCGNNPVNAYDPSGHNFWDDVTAGWNNLTSGLRERSDAVIQDPNWYTVGNWLTLGFFDTVKGAVQPEEPLSAQHWLDSLEVALVVVPLGDALVSTAGSVVRNATKKTTSSVVKTTAASTAKRAISMTPGCFVAGTAVLTETGLRPIETVKTGDMVWAENPETGEKGLKRVVQTFIHEKYELVHVFVNGEEIVTTTEHPFYVPTEGWIGAAHLRAGDILVLSNGEYVTVEKIQHELLETPVLVYNFEVEDFHTYFVGDSSVLVHNTCPKHIYSSIRNAPGYKSGFVRARNGLRKVNVNDKQLLAELREVGSGWKKVYEDGYLYGEKVSYHYFQDKSGQIFDFKIKWGWSNL